jgi:hypothetical protein
VESNFKYASETTVNRNVSVEVNAHNNGVMSLRIAPMMASMGTILHIHSPDKAREIAAMLTAAADAVDPPKKPE